MSETQEIEVRRDLIDEARALNVDVHKAAEEGVTAAIRRARWALENVEVIDSTNAYIERHGAAAPQVPEILMAQFDVYRMAGGELAIDIQTNLISDFNSRVVVPLLPPGEAPVAHLRLNPMIEVEGRPMVVVMQFLLAIDRRELGTPIGNAAPHYDRLKDAYDMLFNGF